jgi:hypothetical protein
VQNKTDCHKKTVGLMIGIYCRDNHNVSGKNNGALCSFCSKLRDYCYLKLDKCIYGKDKPVCVKCKTHCYSEPVRKEIKTVMRYSGPKMLLSYPFLTVRYICRKLAR